MHVQSTPSVCAKSFSPDSPTYPAAPLKAAIGGTGGCRHPSFKLDDRFFHHPDFLAHLIHYDPLEVG